MDAQGRVRSGASVPGLPLVGKEEFDPENIKAIRDRNDLPLSDEECQYLAEFHIEGVRSLIGKE